MGCTPTVSCGLLLNPALAGAVLSAVFGWRGPGAWALLLSTPAFVVILAILQYVPWTLELFFGGLRRCPDRGAQGRSFPCTQGFRA